MSCPIPFTHRKEPWYSLTRRMGKPQNQFGYSGHDKHEYPLPDSDENIQKAIRVSKGFKETMHIKLNTFKELH
jgi:hypothetical protein